MNGLLSLYAVCEGTGSTEPLRVVLEAATHSSTLSVPGVQCSPFTVMQLACFLPLLSQESVSSLGRKQERVLTIQLGTQNLEGGEGEEEDLISRDRNE